MAYTILNNDGTVLLRLADGTVNSTLTSVAFVGRDVAKPDISELFHVVLRTS